MKGLFTNVGQEPHKARALDGLGKFALMFGTDTRVAGIDDFCLARNKPLQEVYFFVINVL
jgi:hypothetical protein